MKNFEYKLFILFLFHAANLIAQENKQETKKYRIVFEGNYKNAAVKIISDDSLAYQGVITSINPDIIIMAETITLRRIPKKLSIIINHKKWSFKCNPEKPNLYVKKRKFGIYKLTDSNVEREYR